MKSFKTILPVLISSVCTLPAATINLDLATNNSGSISLASGDNDFDFAGLSVDYLIVGGGGGGGAPRNSTGRGGGGGGAGGLLQGTSSISGSQSVVVGGGGAGNPIGSGSAGSDGGDSSAFSLSANGGGGGGQNATGAGRSGGSGGGGGSSTGGAATPSGQGNAGGTGSSNAGAGGGGAGSAGGSGTANGAAGAGGAGSSLSITGSSVEYARGGNGAAQSAPSDVTPTPGAANTGNGGHGVAQVTQNSTPGGTGGSGIVVARYTGSQVLTGGIVSTVGGDTVHTFNSGGDLAIFSATIAGDISGAGGLVWDEAGTLTLGGGNSYSGNTTVNLGTVLLTGSIGSTSDLILGGGLLDLSSSGVINVLQSNYSIVDANNDIGSSLILGNDTLSVSTFNDGSNDYTQISVVPEPSTALLGAIGLLALLRRRR